MLKFICNHYIKFAATLRIKQFSRAQLSLQQCDLGHSNNTSTLVKTREQWMDARQLKLLLWYAYGSD